MSENQNEGHYTGTIKPVVHKANNLRLHRPQTEGYQKEEIPEQNIPLQIKTTLAGSSKPTLNVNASTYIPKSISTGATTINNPINSHSDKSNQQQSNQNLQTHNLNTNLPIYSNKIGAYNTAMNMNPQINQMTQNYNMGQVNPTYPSMYNVNNMSMMNSNSMINYTYLNQNYPNYHSQAQQCYNPYIANTGSNKFAQNQFYSPQSPAGQQMYNNAYQNKMMNNQITINQPIQNVPINNPMINNSINSNIPSQVSPKLSQHSPTAIHSMQKDANISSTSITSAGAHMKKPINLEAQSFIPKKLKKPSISSEKEISFQTPKEQINDSIQESNCQALAEQERIPTRESDNSKIEDFPEKENKINLKSEIQLKTPVTQSEDIKESDDFAQQIPDIFSLEKKDYGNLPDEKPLQTSQNQDHYDENKIKPKTLLGSILNQSLANNVDAKQVFEKSIINSVTNSQTKKKLNDVNKALDEKAKLLKEKEKLKKEEILKEELKQKQAETTRTPISNRKPDKEKKKNLKKEEKEFTDTVKIKSKEQEKEEINIIPKELIVDSHKNIEENEEKNYIIEKVYFRVYENEDVEKIKNRYSFDYLFSFRNWKICKENLLIAEIENGHFKQLKETCEEVSTVKPARGVENKSGFGKRGTKYRDEPIHPKISNESTLFQRSKIEFRTPEPKVIQINETGEGLGKWGRKDLSKEEKIASEFKTRREEEIKKDPIRFKLTEHLNTITIDNFAETKQNIMELIYEGQENQEKFIEVLFKKAVTEKSYVVIYARLCKEVDRELTPKEDNSKSSIIVKKPPIKTSVFRSKLLEKCKNVFKQEDQEELILYSNIKDPEEKQQRQKAFLLGNVNFIAEMIINKILSKKVVNQCINNLFTRVEKCDKDNEFMKHVCLEGIVILIDKFGTLVNRQDTKIKAEEQQKFNEDIESYLNRLNDTQENDKSLPGFIRFKIINLIEKKNKDWEESIVESTRKIKGKDEVREEHEIEQRGGTIKPTTRGAKLDQDMINMKIKEEMSNWKEYKKLGKNRNFNWIITESILGSKNNIGEILTAFGENCIDFVGKPEDIDIAYSYIYEILDFYLKNIGEKDKKDIKNTTNFFLSNLNDLILDNNLLIDIWGAVLYALYDFKIYTYKDLEDIQDLQENQLNTIFEVVAKSLEYFDEEKKLQIIKNIQEIGFFKNNFSLLNTYISIVGS